MATVNAAHAMNMDNADVLAVGKYADIILYNLSQEDSKESADIINNLVYKGNESNVRLTMINGKILYENGRYYLTEGVDKINEMAEEISRRIENEL